MAGIHSGNRPGDRIALTISTPLKEKVRTHAEIEGVTMTDWVLEAVKQRLAREALKR